MAIPLPALFCMLPTHRRFLTVAFGREPLFRNPQTLEVLFSRLGSLGTQGQVVLVGAPLVTMALDLHPD